MIKFNKLALNPGSLLFVAIVTGVAIGVLVHPKSTQDFNTTDNNNSTSEEVEAQFTALEQNTTQLSTFIIETDADHNKIAAGYSVNNLRQGQWELYHPNGSISQIGEYNQGLQVGEWKHYNLKGDIILIGHYNDLGQKDGNWIEFHNSGKKLMEGQYASGQKTGLWTSWPYDNNETFYWQGEFVASVKSGEWKWYSEGLLRVVEKFDDKGRLLSRWLYNGGFSAPSNGEDAISR